MIRNTYSFPTDPTPCTEDLADSEAERWADGRRDGDG